MARYPQTVLVSCEIPWDENESLVEDVFRKEIRLTLDAFSMRNTRIGFAGSHDFDQMHRIHPGVT